jgi:hypothetical protein
MTILLSRLFGAGSAEARATGRSPAAWRKTLRRVDEELLQYLDANVHTDPVHEMMLHYAVLAADKALDDEDFWPAYAEAMVRLALLLMGDYPDHRRRKGSGKRTDHYRLSYHRTIGFIRDPEQKYRWLHAGKNLGETTFDPRDAWFSYQTKVGKKATRKGFLRWFRDKHPAEYAKLF